VKYSLYVAAEIFIINYPLCRARERERGTRKTESAGKRELERENVALQFGAVLGMESSCASNKVIGRIFMGAEGKMCIKNLAKTYLPNLPVIYKNT